MGVGGQHHTLAALPPGMTQYPFYWGLGGPHGQSGKLWNISPPPGFSSWTMQPIASCCTNYAIPAHVTQNNVKKCWLLLCPLVYNYYFKKSLHE